MSNMSYCRFENTSSDLADCVDAIRNGEVQDLNTYEKCGLRGLLALAKDVVDYEDIIEEALS